MISQWWSFSLTLFGALGILLTYRFNSKVLGPTVGLTSQGIWIAYALATQQWWFLVSAFLYGSVHIYGIHSRRKKKQSID